jgi:hypothetical protein
MQVTDREQLLPMVESIRASTQTLPQTLLADAGYWDTTSLRHLLLQGIQVLMSPDAEVRPETALAQTVPKSEEAMQMRELPLSPAGRALYSFTPSDFRAGVWMYQGGARLASLPFPGDSLVCSWNGNSSAPLTTCSNSSAAGPFWHCPDFAFRIPLPFSVRMSPSSISVQSFSPTGSRLSPGLGTTGGDRGDGKS